MKKLMSFTRYPVRPQIWPGESLPSFVWRFMKMNGHEVETPINLMLMRLREGNEVEEACALFKRLTGKAALVSRYAALRPLVVAAGGKRPPPWQRMSNCKIQFCPTCLLERGTQQLYWELPLVSVCLEHAVRLVSRCRRCDVVLSWDVLVDKPCRCGAMAREDPPVRAAGWEMHLSRLLLGSSDLVGLLEDPQSRHGLLLGAPYTAGEFYRLLEWVHGARLFYGHKSAYEEVHPNRQRRQRQRPKVPHLPEALFLARLPRSAEKAVDRLLKWFFPEDAKPLVNIESTRLLEPFRNPYVYQDAKSGAAFEAIERAIHARLHVTAFHIDGMTVQVNPRLVGQAWLTLGGQFDDWWKQLVVNASSLPAQDAPPRKAAYRSGLLLDVLNGFLLAAKEGCGAGCFGKLARRWPIPADLTQARSPETQLRKLCSYLESLSEGELAFVRELLAEGLSESRNASGTR